MELACGTGPLARLWTARGIEAGGVDRSVRSLERARALSSGRTPKGWWKQGDLRSFRLPAPVDLAAVPLDSLGYLTTPRSFHGFFRSARAALRPGGVLAADLTLHPETSALPIRNSWRVDLRPGGELRVSWNSFGRPWGSPRRRWEVGRVDVRAPDRTRQVYWEAAPHAVLSAGELAGLALESEGFGPMTVFSDSAYRSSARRLSPLRSDDGAVGARLVAWVRA